MTLLSIFVVSLGNWKSGVWTSVGKGILLLLKICGLNKKGKQKRRTYSVILLMFGRNCCLQRTKRTVPDAFIACYFYSEQSSQDINILTL